MTRPSQRYFETFATTKNITFIETGLLYGGGVDAALKAGFENVISIEPVLDFINRCTPKFQRQIDKGSVTFLHGGSETQLQTAIGSVKGPICYWLDGHFQGQKEGDEANCPIEAEIEAIVSRKNRDSDIILIDDLRLIRRKDGWKGHDAEIDRTLGRLVEAFPRHYGMYLDGHVENDVFAVIPSFLMPQIWQIRAPEIQAQLLK